MIYHYVDQRIMFHRWWLFLREVYSRFNMHGFIYEESRVRVPGPPPAKASPVEGVRLAVGYKESPLLKTSKLLTAYMRDQKSFEY